MQSEPGTAEGILAPFRSTVIRYFALVGSAAVTLLLVTAPLRAEPPIVFECYLGLLLALAASSWMRSRYLALAGAVCALVPLALVAVLVWVRGGLSHPAGVMAFATMVAIAGLGWSSRGAWIVAGLSSAVFAWFLTALPGALQFSKAQVWFELSVQLAMVVVLVHFGLKLLTQSYHTALSHEQRFRDVIESSPDAMIALDSLGVVQLFNPSAVAMSGVPAVEARGKTLSELGWLKAQSLGALKEALQHIEAGGAALPLVLEVAKGQVLEANVVLVTRQESQPDRLISLRDVTERQAAVQAREALEARITQSKSIEALGRLAGGVAHDFNNMLTVISGTVELMMMRGSNERPDLLRIRDASLRAAELTSHLLSFGRKQVLQPRVVCPNSALVQLKPLLERLVRKNIELLVQLDPHLGNIYVDEARLEQVVVNLVTNGSDAMPGGGKLTLETQNREVSEEHANAHPGVTPGEYVVIAVSDTGDGMAPETYSRIFEPFFTTKTTAGGTGLGLAMVHGIVTQSGGHILVASEPGKGTTFRLHFPRSLEGALSPIPPPTVAPRLSGPARVLLTEDQAEVRASTRRMLEALGHDVVEATDGSEALALYGASIDDFDLLVSDVVMPNLGGPDLARRLCALSPKLKVLLISGYAEDATFARDVLNERVRFLSKPFNHQSLGAMLCDLLVVDTETDRRVLNGSVHPSA